MTITGWHLYWLLIVVLASLTVYDLATDEISVLGIAQPGGLLWLAGCTGMGVATYNEGRRRARETADREEAIRLAVGGAVIAAIMIGLGLFGLIASEVSEDIAVSADNAVCATEPRDC